MVWQARRGDAGGSIRDPPPCVGRGVRPRRPQVPATTIAAARVFTAAMIDSTQTPGTRTHSDPRAATTSAAGAATVRTRFAPSPTGFLHIGGVRTALYAWAYARHFDGDFILRIEDTDVERSTPEAVAAIIDGMSWLGSRPTKVRSSRCSGWTATARCWRRCSPTAAPTTATARRPNSRTCARRSAPAARSRVTTDAGGRRMLAGRQPPAGVEAGGALSQSRRRRGGWDDMVKGPIAIANAELDDLIIARSDGTPTYNFCVVVDDWDMAITHVIRGDDHVNNTPRQINILRALRRRPAGLRPPADDPRPGRAEALEAPRCGVGARVRAGSATCRRRSSTIWRDSAGAMATTRSSAARQLVAWFDGSHLSAFAVAAGFRQVPLGQPAVPEGGRRPVAGERRSAAARRPGRRSVGGCGCGGGGAGGGHDCGSRSGGPAAAAAPSVAIDPRELEPSRLWPTIALLWKERAATLEDLADLSWRCSAAGGARSGPAGRPARRQYASGDPGAGRKARDHATTTTGRRPRSPRPSRPRWPTTGLKMPALAVPVRLVVFGREQTPSLDAMLALLGRSATLERLAAIGRNSPLCAGE